MKSLAILSFAIIIAIAHGKLLLSAYIYVFSITGFQCILDEGEINYEQ